MENGQTELPLFYFNPVNMQLIPANDAAKDALNLEPLEVALEEGEVTVLHADEAPANVAAEDPAE